MTQTMLRPITVAEYKDQLLNTVTRSREVMMLWGPPGGGKSQIGRQFVRELDEGIKAGAYADEWFGDYEGAELVQVNVGHHESVDFMGIPDLSGTVTRWRTPEMLPFEGNPDFRDDILYVVFLDEVNAATKEVFGVLMQLLDERRVGQHKLRENVVMFAAGNRESDRGVTSRMPTTNANRFTHFELGIDVKGWCAHAADMAWPVEVIAFHMRWEDGSKLSTFDPDKPDKAFATPRTWEKWIKYYTDPKRDETSKRLACDGAIGIEVSSDAFAFIAEMKELPSIDEIERSPEKTPLPDKLDMRYAVATMISVNMTVGNVNALHTYLKRMSADFVVMAWTMAQQRIAKAIKKGLLQKKDELENSKAFMDYAKTYAAVFRP